MDFQKLTFWGTEQEAEGWKADVKRAPNQKHICLYAILMKQSPTNKFTVTTLPFGIYLERTVNKVDL